MASASYLKRVEELSQKPANELLAMILIELKEMASREELDLSLSILQKEILVLQKGVFIQGGTVKVKNDLDEGQREPLYVRDI